MRYLLCLFFLISLPLAADISIQVTKDKSVLAINQQLNVAINIEHPANMPPDLFAFLYDLDTEPFTSFRIVSSKIEPKDDRSTTVLVTLEPLHTGTLIFDPGILTFQNSPYLVPAFSIECPKTPLATLQLAGLKPLYPERRVEINAAVRILLNSANVLKAAEKQNVQVWNRFRDSRGIFLLIVFAIPVALLGTWFLYYFEIMQRANRPKPIQETALQLLVKKLKEPGSPPKDRWELLAKLIKEALGTLENENFQSSELIFVRQKVNASQQLSSDEKKWLSSLFDTLEEACYMGKPVSEETWQKSLSSSLSWINQKAIA